jgi:hypothetical protein
MTRLHGATVLSAALICLLGTPCLAKDASWMSRPVRTVVLDAGSFYLNSTNLLHMGIGVATAAVPANTNVDRWIRDKDQRDLRSQGTDDVAKIVKIPGNGFVTVPVYVATYGAALLLKNPTLEDWGQNPFEPRSLVPRPPCSCRERSARTDPARATPIGDRFGVRMVSVVTPLSGGSRSSPPR